MAYAASSPQAILYALWYQRCRMQRTRISQFSVHSTNSVDHFTHLYIIIYLLGFQPGLEKNYVLKI